MKEDEDFKKLLKSKENKFGKGAKLGIVAGIVAVIVLALIFVGPMFFNSSVKGTTPNNNNLPIETPSSTPTQIVEVPATFPYPVENWQQSLYSSQDQNELKTAILSSLKSSKLLQNMTNLPAEEAGYFTDPSKAKNKDGTINQFYTPLTQESSAYEIRKDVEILVNPVFGGWSKLQINTDSDTSDKLLDSMKNLFSESYLKNANGKSLPLFVDWKNNSFGSSMVPKDSNWFGHVDSITSKIEVNKKTHKPQIQVTAKITFQSVATDGSIDKKPGTLKLVFVQKSGEYNSNQTLTINEASFKTE